MPQPDTDPLRQAIEAERWRLTDRIAALQAQASSPEATVQDKQTLAEAYGARKALQWVLFDCREGFAPADTLGGW